jgi:hypothetical protein
MLAIAIDISKEDDLRTDGFSCSHRSIDDREEISWPPMIWGHGAHEDCVRAPADLREGNGVGGIRLYQPHTLEPDRVHGPACQDDVMSILTKQASCLCPYRTCTHDNVETHYNLFAFW